MNAVGRYERLRNREGEGESLTMRTTYEEEHEDVSLCVERGWKGQTQSRNNEGSRAHLSLEVREVDDLSLEGGRELVEGLSGGHV